MQKLSVMPAVERRLRMHDFPGFAVVRERFGEGTHLRA